VIRSKAAEKMDAQGTDERPARDSPVSVRHGSSAKTPAASQNILDLRRCNYNALKGEGIPEPSHPLSGVCRYALNGSPPLSTDYDYRIQEAICEFGDRILFPELNIPPSTIRRSSSITSDSQKPTPRGFSYERSSEQGRPCRSARRFESRVSLHRATTVGAAPRLDAISMTRQVARASSLLV
jgi:hypothetical protein